VRWKITIRLESVFARRPYALLSRRAGRRYRAYARLENIDGDSIYGTVIADTAPMPTLVVQADQFAVHAADSQQQSLSSSAGPVAHPARKTECKGIRNKEHMREERAFLASDGNARPGAHRHAQESR
jgi:hypothetical protein